MTPCWMSFDARFADSDTKTTSNASCKDSHLQVMSAEVLEPWQSQSSAQTMTDLHSAPGVVFPKNNASFLVTTLASYSLGMVNGNSNPNEGDIYAHPTVCYAHGTTRDDSRRRT